MNKSMTLGVIDFNNVVTIIIAYSLNLSDNLVNDEVYYGYLKEN